MPTLHVLEMKILTILCGAIAVPTIAFSDPHYLGSRYSGGILMEWYVTTEKVAPTERWDGQGPIPFDIDELVLAGRTYLKEEHGISGDVPMEGLGLRRVHGAAQHTDLVDRWFLTIDFGGAARGTIASRIRILTDASILSPVITDEPEPDEGDNSE